MRLRRLVLAALLAWGAAKTARGEEFARLERVEVEPSFEGLARVRAWLTLVQHDGRLIDGVNPDELTLHLGNAKRADTPWVIPFEESGAALEVALVVEVGIPYASSLESIVPAGTKFIKELPRHARVAVIPYGATVGRGRLGDPNAAQRTWKRLRSEEEEASSLQLAKALEKAVKLLASAKSADEAGPPPRRVVVVISDGIEGSLDEEVDPERKKELRRRIQKVAKLAIDSGVTVHTIGFTPDDFRPPLVNLGELSRKTRGTFRWALEADMVDGQLGLLGDEIRKQMVATWFVPADAIVGKQVTVSCASSRCSSGDELVSNEVKLPAGRCGASSCDTGGLNVCVAQACIAFDPGSGGPGLLTIALIAGVVVAGGAGVLWRRNRGEPSGLRPIGPPVVAPPQPPPQRQAQPPPQPHVVRPQPIPPRAAPPVQGIGWFYVTSGPRQGQHIALRHGFTIGKAPGNDLVIDDGFTSGRHAQVVVDQNGAHVVDLGSTNGTFVNGTRTMRAPLVHGTSVRVGQTELRFLRGQA